MHHHHEHTHESQSIGGLRTAFVLTLAILAIEFVFGILANSLALLSDAGHILTDAVALGLAWYATHLSSRPPDARNTFGFHRGGILAALFNAAVLLCVAAAVIFESVLRLKHPQHVSGGLLICAACIAVAVNGYILFVLQHHRNHDLNLRAAFLHVLGDLAASAAVVVTGITIVYFHWDLADPILSMVIALLIAYSAWQIVRDTLAILMEGIPAGVELQQLTQAMLEVPGVIDVHDLHVWSISDNLRLLSAHVEVSDQPLADTAGLLADLKLMLLRRFAIQHATIEPECVDCRTPIRRPIALQERRSGERSNRSPDGAAG